MKNASKEILRGAAEHRISESRKRLHIVNKRDMDIHKQGWQDGLEYAAEIFDSCMSRASFELAKATAEMRRRAKE
jgi:hypothetical protein